MKKTIFKIGYFMASWSLIWPCLFYNIYLGLNYSTKIPINPNINSDAFY